jgi:hypothetical protein
MTNGRNDLSLTIKLRDASTKDIRASHIVYLRRKLSVDGVHCEINHRTVPSNIKDGVIVVDGDIAQLERAFKFGFDFLVVQELDAVLVVLKALYDY